MWDAIHTHVKLEAGESSWGQTDPPLNGDSDAPDYLLYLGESKLYLPRLLTQGKMNTFTHTLPEVEVGIYLIIMFHTC